MTATLTPEHQKSVLEQAARRGSRLAPFSGSALKLTLACPASAVLEKTSTENLKAAQGTAQHEHMEMRVTHGIEEAFEGLEGVLAKWGLEEEAAFAVADMCYRFRWTPPKGALTEVAFCYFVDGSVMPVEAADDSYHLPAGGLFPMTIDVMWSEPEPLVWTDDGPRCPAGSTLAVANYKTGSELNVSPIGQNPQLLVGSLLAARYTHAKRVVPSVIYMRPGDGDWDTLPFVLEADDLEGIEEELLTTICSVEMLQQRYERDQPLNFNEGSHCRSCKAEWVCPAKTAMLKRFVDGERPSLSRGGALTSIQASALAGLLPLLRDLTDKADQALRVHVDAIDEPIRCVNGNLWGPHEATKRRVDADIALPILAKHVGEELANGCIRRQITQAAMQRALRDKKKKQPKLKIGAAHKKIMNEVKKAGGVEVIKGVHYGYYREANDQRQEASQEDAADASGQSAEAVPSVRPRRLERSG